MANTVFFPLEPQQVLRSKGKSWTNFSRVPGGQQEGNICRLCGPTTCWSIHKNKGHPVVKQVVVGWLGRKDHGPSLSTKVGRAPGGQAVKEASSRMAGLQGSKLAGHVGYKRKGWNRQRTQKQVPGPLCKSSALCSFLLVAALEPLSPAQEW